MSDTENLLEKARQMVKKAGTWDIVIRLLGGVAVVSLCEDIYQRFPMLRRTPHDIDFMGYSRQSRGISKFFTTDTGFTADQRFNALFGNQRLKFYDSSDENNPMVIDVFLDKFRQSHDLPLLHRLQLNEFTISPTDLLFTKLQIWEINEKDILDILSLLVKFEPSGESNAGFIEIARIEELVGSDWGLWKTSMLNLDRTEKFIGGSGKFSSLDSLTAPRIASIRNAIQNCRKTVSWKMRSLIGEKIQWYETPEEV